MTTVASTARTDDDFQTLVLAELTAIRRLLERRHVPPLTPSDRQLLDAIVDRVGIGIAFSACEIVAHATVDDALRAVLAQCRLADAVAVGRRLARVARHNLGLVRIGRDQDGTVWCLLNDAG
jgi:hypothetical protein